MTEKEYEFWFWLVILLASIVLTTLLTLIMYNVGGLVMFFMWFCITILSSFELGESMTKI